MKSFDDELVHKTVVELFDMVKSKQAEIDEIQKKYNAMHNAFVVADDCRQEWHRCYVGIRQREDELQKRIDRALEKCHTGIRKQGGDYYLELVQDILKGDQS